VGLQVADNDDLNVLGMNYLSSLSRWGVEGRWLILVS
jgi:aspartyl protease family protein